MNMDRDKLRTEAWKHWLNNTAPLFLHPTQIALLRHYPPPTIYPQSHFSYAMAILTNPIF
ncbi:hypothetical protein [Geminocystis sp. NIES-3709]|uniref:hypothetical protein n=1 Tax=Geminocystis sp. NIES-3709 TaxID=1617448 RepID=UPI0005FCA09B|nr:hypothetical protein [Geminocystis sp. NIES-3709]BAQ67105.1 hypothetical protein GM3709_3870 [Geminocystis sp. NIES-3709]